MSDLRHALKAAAPERLGDLALPGPRDERWRYSSLRALLARQFTQAENIADLPADGLAIWAQWPLRLVFVDGVHRPEWSNLADAGIAISATEAPGSRLERPFARAARAAAPHLHVRVRGALEQPLHVCSIVSEGSRDALIQQSMSLHLEAAARLRVVHHRLAPVAHAGFVNHARQIDLADQSELHWLEHGDDGDRISVVLASEVQLGAQARFDYAEVAAGAALYRHELDVLLAGEGAAFELRGAAVLSQRRHADLHVDVRHRARDTRANLVWRGMADQRGHAAFTGQLIVEAGADGSDTALQNKNLLLGPHAEIDTRPVLEIHADEVKAAHGATVGRLDEAALFYLRARGIPALEARRILQLAFAREPIGRIPDPALREIAATALDRLLPMEAP